MDRLKKIVDLFLIFLKIGAFTFGGGYAMISIIREECIEKRPLVDEEEFVNMVAVAESTPGPIAINMATYIGFKNVGMIGAVVATLGVITPSIIIIYIISLFFKDFLKIKIVEKAFKGIRLVVPIIILRSAISLIKSEVKASKSKNTTIFFICLFSVIIFVFYALGYNLNTLYIVLFAIIISFVLLIIKRLKGGENNAN